MEALRLAIQSQARTIYGWSCDHWMDSEENDAREALDEMALNNKAAKILEECAEKLKAILPEPQ